MSDAAEFSAASAYKVVEAIAKLKQDVETFMMTKSERTLFDLKAIGATTEQLEEARRLLEQLERMEKTKANAEQIQDAIDQLKYNVKTFFMTEAEKALFDLKALGATEDQLEEARQLLMQLQAMEARRNNQLTYTLAGSAEAQRLAYRAARDLDQRSIDIPKKQLDMQKRMARSLENIERQGGLVGGAGVTVVEWGI